MNDAKRNDEEKTEKEREPMTPAEASAKPIELGRVSKETHGTTGFRFEGFTNKP